MMQADTTIAVLQAPAAGAAAGGAEAAMLSASKMPVVVAVVLVVWLGLLAYVFLTERRLARVERRLADAEAAAERAARI